MIPVARRLDAFPQQCGDGGLEAGVVATVRATIVPAIDEFTFGGQQIFGGLRQKKDRVGIYVRVCSSQAPAGSRRFWTAANRGSLNPGC
jgi:hypothetical protein